MVTASLELARALHRRGTRLTLFFSQDRLPGFEGAAAVLSPHRHELANKLWLRSVEGRAGLDAIIYPYWPPAPARRPGAPPAITFVHDLAFRLRPREVPWQQRLYLGSVLPAALRRSRLIVTPSEQTRRDLLQEFPVAGLAARAHVVPEAPAGLPEGGSAPVGLRPGYLLAVGTLEPRKNYPRLLAAYRRLRGSAGAAPALVVAGRPGWSDGALERLVRSEPGVAYLGHVDDATLGALYEHAGALAFPSLYEGFGLPLVEAMARGVPALVSRAGALPEVAAGAAVEVDPESVEEIAQGLERLLGDAALRADLAERGRRRAAELTWDAAAQRLEALIATLDG
jgi:alpha-1,3-rhamnosyl/mannosyltransferase